MVVYEVQIACSCGDILGVQQSRESVAQAALNLGIVDGDRIMGHLDRGLQHRATVAWTERRS